MITEQTEEISARFVDFSKRREDMQVFVDQFGAYSVYASGLVQVELIDNRNKNDLKTEIHDAMRVFHTVTAYDGFTRAPIILFLNKKDLLQQKLKKVPLTVAFPEYKGKNDFTEACQFIQHKFESCVIQTPERLTIHVTNATDTSNIRSVFDASLAVILDQA